jgi:hypothetical protein
MYEPSWKDVEICSYAANIILCASCLVLLYEFVDRRCEAIFLAGGDCGVGYGWIGLAAGIVVVGVFSAWKVYRLVGARSAQPVLFRK